MNLSPEDRALLQKLEKRQPELLEELKKEHMKEFRFRKNVRAAAGLYGKLPSEEESPDSLVEAVRNRVKTLIGIK